MRITWQSKCMYSMYIDVFTYTPSINAGASGLVAWTYKQNGNLSVFLT
jgi:hypothetical protein